MQLLFSKREILKMHDADVAREAEKKGEKKGLRRGVEMGIRAMVLFLKENAQPPAAIAQVLVKQFGLSQDAAEKKVQQYWA